MLSFIGAYKVLARVLPNSSQIIPPLDNAIAGHQSREKIYWTDELYEHLNNAQKLLNSTRSITLPRPSDQLWIVTGVPVSKYGIGATLYVSTTSFGLIVQCLVAQTPSDVVTMWN